MSSKTAATAAPTGKDALPKKEQELFKQLVSLYENKQFKKSLKNADQILSKFPNHGETLAMKGLSLNSLGKKDEAYELVKLGVKNDLKSSICWHVYGLIYKSDSNFVQAIKSYLQALKLDENNHNILRDLSFLQLQVRDYQGFLTSRTKILSSKGSMRTSWVAFAIATYLTKDYKRSFDIISKCVPDDKEKDIFNESIEPEAQSELLLFQSKCLEKEGKYDAVIAHFKKNEAKIKDKLYVRRKTAELQVLMGRFTEALPLWVNLVNEQSDNYSFHRGLQCAFLQLSRETSAAMFASRSLDLPCTVLPLSQEKKQELAQYYKEMNFKSRAVPKICLFLLEGEQFKEHLKSHLIDQIRREIPSLYQDICALVRVKVSGTDRLVCTKEPWEFRNHPVTVVANQLVEEITSNLRRHGTFDGSSVVESKKEAPSALLWALFLQAHLFEVSGRLDEALRVIDEAAVHTPTALDILLKKARILKQTGEFQLAAQLSNE
jgi:tetratricopeptide (TPR) repeat protein